MIKKNNSKTHFVFDLDDTLVDGRQFCGETIVRSIQQLDPKANAEAIMNLHEVLKGGAIVDIYRQILSELNLKLDINKLLEIDRNIQESEFSRMKTFEGVVEILEFLKSKGKKLHICTNRIETTMIPILKHLKIDGYFDNIISCIDRGFKKPDPTCLLELIKENGGDKEDFIYFGDSEIDSKFAKNSNVDFIIFDQYLNEKNLFKKLINLFLEEKLNGEDMSLS